uniref:Uncharacterized protein n=1 Tax=viral metagenome TaxID=1070528 RepID=A0A6M3LRX3_9ZZZZ
MDKKDIANMGMIRIDSRHCWKCNEVMTTSGIHKRTSHHAIPKFLKPVRNVEMPVCDKCHKEINAFTVQSMPKLEAVDNLIKNLKLFITKYEKVIKRYEKKDE